MRRPKGPIAPGYIRRTSPTACSVMPYTGTTPDDMAQLATLARAHARHVPYGIDWPLEFWAERIDYDGDDTAGRLWLDAYANRHTNPDRHTGNETKH